MSVIRRLISFPRISEDISRIPQQSVRTYIANFWSRKTAYRFPGHMVQNQNHFKYKGELRIEIHDFPRPHNIRRLKYASFDYHMKTVSGRNKIMSNMLKGNYQLTQGW